MISEELAIRRKIIKIGVIITGTAYFIGNWIATQLAARACDYNELLGTNLSFSQDIHIYPPYAFYLWMHNDLLVQAIPNILADYNRVVYLAAIAGMLFSYFVTKGMQKNTSHGSASFATAEEIETTKLDAVETGVVVGVNPYTKRLMLHNGSEHLLLVAPTRGGKGVNTILPTGLIWSHSIFFFDVKAELWQSTAGYRRDVLKQKVMKFEPLCVDGSTARWNPLAEINFRTLEEFSDVKTIVAVLIKPDGDTGKDPFWDNSGSALLNCVILHLLYKHYQEGRPIPCLTDVMSFLSSPDKDIDELFDGMKRYPHISKEEFLELEYVDAKGETKQHSNILKYMYGEYIRDFTPFNEALQCNVRTLDELKNIIKEHDDVDFTESPFDMLLVHPKVAENAANMLNIVGPTRASIMITTQTCLALYQNPVVQRNTAVSDFFIKDLLDPSQAISMYLVMQLDDIETLKPLSRLFINTMLSKLIRDLKFEKDTNKEVRKQRLLLMLDEFPQLGCLKKIELALAVCAGYGIKICIVSQDVNQLNKEYTKDNSIASNCHIHIYFTPNLDTNGGTTAEAISKALGKKTITTNSHSDGGGVFKGSNSTSYMARDLMTPDEVSHMNGKKELVFVAGHKPIFGDKFRYYEHKYFLEKILPEPLYSDTATKIATFEDLFRVHAAESKARIERKRLVDEAKANAAFLKKVAMENANNQKGSQPIEIEASKTSENTEEIIEGAWPQSACEVVEPVEIASAESVESKNEENTLEKETTVVACMQNYMKKKEKKGEAETCE